MMLVSIRARAHYLKSQSNQDLAVDEHEKDQNEDQDHTDEKVINEGTYGCLCYNFLLHQI